MKKGIVGCITVGMLSIMLLPANGVAQEYPDVIDVYDKNNDVTTTEPYQTTKQTFEKEAFSDPEYSAYMTMKSLYGDGFKDSKEILPVTEEDFWKKVEDAYQDEVTKDSRGVIVKDRTFTPEELAKARANSVKTLVKQIVNYQVLSSKVDGDNATVEVEIYPVSTSTFGRQVSYVFFDYVGEAGYFNTEEPFSSVRTQFGQIMYLEENIAPLAKKPVSFKMELSKDKKGNFAPKENTLEDLFNISLSEEYAFIDEEGRINSSERFYLNSNFEKDTEEKK